MTKDEEIVAKLTTEGAQTRQAEQLLEFVKNCYTGRAYHNWEHIQDCLTVYSTAFKEMPVANPKATTRDFELPVAHLFIGLDDVDPPQRNKGADLVALVFHDVVYDPLAKDNEERSAQMTENYLRQIGVNGNFVAAVKERILATKHTMPPNEETKYVADTDLSILGSWWKDFEEYRKKIRTEYWFCDDETFKKGTIEFYKGMLARKAIYTTPELQYAFEEQARKNMERGLREMEAK